MQSTILISVVIPTFNRPDVLSRTLLALNQQTLSCELFEVILVDDGSEEDINGIVSSLRLVYSIVFIRQRQLGPAAARNRGSQEARGEVILFLDNDMIAVPELLTEHLKSHQFGQNNGCIGRVVVGPRSRYAGVAADPFIWLDYRPDGSDLRLDKQPISFQELFTCNLSIRRCNWQMLNGFREEFKTASFEDIEFAYRATQAGLGLEFNLYALAYHDHPLKFEERLTRTFSYTRTVPLLYQMHPELRGQITHLVDKEPIDLQKDSFQRKIRKLAWRGLAWKPVLALMKWILVHSSRKKPGNKLVKFFYWKVIGVYQLLGLQDGIHLYGWTT